MQKFIGLMLVMFIALNNLYAQQSNVKGVVKDEKGNVITVATVSLLNATDTSWVQTQLTGDKGEFAFDAVKEGNYLINIQATGFQKIFKPVTVFKDNKDIIIALNKSLNELKEVTVNSKAPRIENGLGKTVVNLEQATTIAGSSVLDLLRKSPGVVVDASGNVNLKGVEALVLVDDKQTYMSGTQLADYLKSLPAEQVAQLELISQPSSKYDAEGAGGIVNIKMRKNKKSGYNGSLTSSASQGVYPSTHNTAAFNYRNGKWNVYTNAGYMLGNGFVVREDKRSVSDQQTNTLISTTTQHTYRHETFEDYNLKLGADYTVNDKANVGGSVKGIYHPNNELDATNTVINESNSNTTYNNTANAQGFKRNHLLANAYASYKPKEGQEVNFNADYLYRSQKDYQNVNSDNYNGQQQPIGGGQTLRSNSPSMIQAVATKLDYSNAITKTCKIEAGLKTSFANLDNGVYFDVLNNGVWQTDTIRTNQFIYKENINAAYVNLSKDFGDKWKTQLGLRAENANIYGNQITQAQEFNRNNTSLFPTAFAGYTIDKKNSLELSCGRRINRPSYTELNPFVMIFSQYYYYKGNPDLKPSFRNYVELKYNFNNVLFASVGYRKVKGSVNPILLYDAATKATYATWGNFANRNILSGSLSYNEQILKEWLISGSIDGYYNEFHTVNGNALLATSFGYSVGINNQFTFGKGWGVDSSFYYSSGDLQNLIDRYGPSMWMDCSISKKIWKDSATIKLSAEDPFKLNSVSSTTNINGIATTSSFKFASQQFSLGFTYNFGKKIDNAPQQHQTNSEEAGRM